MNLSHFGVEAARSFQGFFVMERGLFDFHGVCYHHENNLSEIAS